MSDQPLAPPPGWYPYQGDPPGTQRFWNGSGWEGGPRPVPGVAVGDLFPLADLARRAGARAIDLVIWLVVLSIGWAVAGRAALTGLTVVVAVLVIFGYEAYLVGSSGATVGKWVLGLTVVSEDGSPTDFAAGLRRAALLGVIAVVSFVPFLWVLTLVVVPLLALAGLLMIYADDRQQTPWDKIGRTLVVVR